MHNAKEKLLLISEVMSDAYLWSSVLILVEEWEGRADKGAPDAREFMTHFSVFYRLCKYVKTHKAEIIGE